MTYQFKFLTFEFTEVETTLNALGAEGWQLVSCWPSGPQLMAILQWASAPPAGAADPSSPAPAATAPPVARLPFTLQEVLDKCLAKNPLKPGYPHGLRVTELAQSMSLPYNTTYDTLRAYGLKTKEESPGHHRDTVVKSHAIWLNQTKENFWFVNALPLSEGKSASPRASKPRRKKRAPMPT